MNNKFNYITYPQVNQNVSSSNKISNTEQMDEILHYDVQKQLR